VEVTEAVSEVEAVIEAAMVAEIAGATEVVVVALEAVVVTVGGTVVLQEVVTEGEFRLHLR